MKPFLLGFSAVLFLLVGCEPQIQPPAASEDATTAQASDYRMEEPKAHTADCQLTMGFDAWEPYQYVGVGNVVTGLDVEIVHAIAKSMECSVAMRQGTWVELLSALRDGEVDFVLGASMTDDRQQFAHFSDPYREEQFILYVRRYEGNLPYNNITEFVQAGRKLGIVNEYFYGDEITALYTNDDYHPQFVGAIISEMNMARLIDEEIDGFLEDSFVGASILRRKGLDQYIEPHGIRLESSQVYVMFSRASVDEAMVEKFNAGLAQIKASGVYQQIIEKYDH
ncbi:substrate-binding periplasmic protein [Alkalimonas amylolytica]|uniref:Polar amino acid transport system substrate-binding protein n=1 Tax=Alkalimonas amylolytica TaxID=152573 RepID=A0A1H4BCE9_ALKAM|nr:transporter substrate-binding domain-containing protein [Alkalimonas amylolytica]SEA45734.1 polar amino acid transport system substrate-binding protein [Alkalimonas amylolytica]